MRLNTLGRHAAMPRTPVAETVNDSFGFEQEKCAQYWPTTEELQMSFTDTGFTVRLLSEEDRSYYTIRALELQNTAVSWKAGRCWVFFK